MKRFFLIILVSLTCAMLGWFFGEPIRRAANRLLPSALGGASLLPKNRLPSARPWKEELQEITANWQTPESAEGFRQDYELYQSLQTPARACALARLIAEWHAFEAEDLYSFTLTCEDRAFVDHVLQLSFQLDTEASLTFVSTLGVDEAERQEYLQAWLTKASQGDRKQIRNLIVEHRLASSNDDPLLAFADSGAQQVEPVAEILPPITGHDVREQWQSHQEIPPLEDSFRKWMQQAPDDARQWTAEQKSPALLDLWRLCQVERLTQSPGGTPRSAYELSLEIAEAPQQKRAVEIALRHWLKVDPQGAITAIAEAPLEEADRDQLTLWANSKVALLDIITKAAP